MWNLSQITEYKFFWSLWTLYNQLLNGKIQEWVLISSKFFNNIYEIIFLSVDYAIFI